MNYHSEYADSMACFLSALPTALPLLDFTTLSFILFTSLSTPSFNELPLRTSVAKFVADSMAWFLSALPITFPVLDFAALPIVWITGLNNP